MHSFGSLRVTFFTMEQFIYDYKLPNYVSRESGNYPLIILVLRCGNISVNLLWLQKMQLLNINQAQARLLKFYPLINRHTPLKYEDTSILYLTWGNIMKLALGSMVHTKLPNTRRHLQYTTYQFHSRLPLVIGAHYFNLGQKIFRTRLKQKFWAAPIVFRPNKSIRRFRCTKFIDK